MCTTNWLLLFPQAESYSTVLQASIVLWSNKDDLTLLRTFD
jgi:hypothetical protein